MRNSWQSRPSKPVSADSSEKVRFADLCPDWLHQSTRLLDSHQEGCFTQRQGIGRKLDGPSADETLKSPSRPDQMTLTPDVCSPVPFFFLPSTSCFSLFFFDFWLHKEAVDQHYGPRDHRHVHSHTLRVSSRHSKRPSSQQRTDLTLTRHDRLPCTSFILTIHPIPPIHQYKHPFIVQG